LNEPIAGFSNERPIYLSEVTDIEIVRRKQDGFTLRNGYPAYYIAAQRDSEGELIAVTGSLVPGTRVVVRGAENLVKGATVQVMLSQSAHGVAMATEG